MYFYHFNQSKLNHPWFRLTKWISGNHPLRVDGLRDAESVFSTDSEAIFFARCQFGHSEAGFSAGCRHSDPVTLADVTLLHYVVGDVTATILLRGVPQQCAGINVLLCDLQRSLRGSRDICRVRDDDLSFIIHILSTIKIFSIFHFKGSSFTSQLFKLTHDNDSEDLVDLASAVLS